MDLELLKKRDIDGAKRLITSVDINVLRDICRSGPDDPELLLHYLAINPKETASQLRFGLYWACKYNKPCLARVFVDHGASVCEVNRFGRNALDVAFERSSGCTRVLLVCGAKTSTTCGRVPYWASKFLRTKKITRKACIVVLGLNRSFPNYFKDVLRIIARCIWATRAEEYWIKKK